MNFDVWLVMTTCRKRRVRRAVLMRCGERINLTWRGYGVCDKNLFYVLIPLVNCVSSGELRAISPPLQRSLFTDSNESENKLTRTISGHFLWVIQKTRSLRWTLAYVNACVPLNDKVFATMTLQNDGNQDSDSWQWSLSAAGAAARSRPEVCIVTM